MPYNLLLLPLMGGFLFFYTAHVLRFSAQRLEGYQLLFAAAVAGTGLATIGRLIVVALAQLPIAADFHRWWWIFSPFPYSGTSALAFVLGPVLAAVVNLCVGRQKAKDIEVRRHGNSLIQLLYRAEREKQLISITLENRKWYVGWVGESPNLRPDERYFILLPFVSGYRDKDKLETYRTVFYEDALMERTQSAHEFAMVLPLDKVHVANVFNPDVYNEYFAETENTGADGSPAAP